MAYSNTFNFWLNFCVYIQLLLILLTGQINCEDNFKEVKAKALGVVSHTRDKSNDPTYVLNQYFNHVIPSYFSRSVFCSDVSTSVGLLMNRIRTNATLKDTEDAAIQDCVVTKHYPAYQCKGFVERYVPTLYYIVRKRPNLTTDTVVTTSFQSYGCGVNKLDPYMEWSIKINETTPSKRHIRSQHKSDVFDQKQDFHDENYSRVRPSVEDKESKSPRRSRGLVKILQLTDINLDIYYEPNTNAECEGFGPCCEADSGKPKNQSSLAGVYGDARTCDTPDILLDNGLKRIAQDHPDIDIIYMTGDLCPHNQWRSTHLGNADVVAYVSQLIGYYFPTATIVPVIGDQDTHPAHQFSPAGELSIISTQWIYSATFESWTRTQPPWISLDQIVNFQTGGYYTKQIGSSLKIIVLNTNICLDRNLWQMYDVRDPNGQLEWFQKELQKAETAGQYVHVLGHVPPGSIGCTKVWSRNYHNIIARYHATVKAQIFGHESLDTFHLFYKPKSHQDPLAVQWVAPSFTPRQSNNPSFRIYYAHPYTWDLMDYDAYVMDLKASNANPRKELQWKFLYRATVAYNLPDLRPDKVANLVERLAVDKGLLATYLQNNVKELNPIDANSCNTYCKKKILCRIVTPYISDEEECQAIQRKIDGVVVPIVGA